MTAAAPTVNQPICLSRPALRPWCLRAHIARLPQVRDVHDLHITQIATGLPVLTAHIVVDDDCYRDGSAHAVLDQLQECVMGHFEVSIDHCTFQIEPLAHVPHETELSH